MDQKHSRHIFFIKKDLQGKQILGFFLFFAGGCLLFVALFLLFSANSMTISYSNHDLQFGQTPLMLLKKVLAANWIVIVLGGGLLVYAALRFTHRIAGPLYRFEKVLDAMLTGKLTETIHLRSKDEGKELAKKINDFNTQLTDSVQAVRRNTTAVSELLDQLEEVAASDGPRDKIRSLLWSLREQNRKNMAVCDRYTVKDA